MAATNKYLARNDKSRTWVKPTKKRRTPSRHGDSRRRRRLAPLITGGRFEERKLKPERKEYPVFKTIAAVTATVRGWNRKSRMICSVVECWTYTAPLKSYTAP